VLELFPELSELDYQALSARTIAEGPKARHLAERHVKNGQRLIPHTWH